MQSKLAHMKKRCEDPHNSRYKHYGGRGIVVCKRWRDSLDAFIDDMGPPPGPDRSIDRIDNDGPYAPDNVRWATRKEQGRNKTNNIIVLVDGQPTTLPELAETLNADYKQLYNRITRKKDQTS